MIKATTYLRLRTLSEHPKADMTLEAMLALCDTQDIDFEDYATTLTMQLAIIDAMDEYSKARRAAGENQSQVMRGCAGASAIGLAWLTREEPLPGSDVATMIANDVVYAFASFLGPRVAWIQPPEVKRPTNDAPATRQ